MIDILLVSYAIFITFFIYNFFLFGFIGTTSLYFYLTRITNVVPNYFMLFLYAMLFCFIIYASGMTEMFISMLFTLLFYYIVFRILLMIYNFLMP